MSFQVNENDYNDIHRKVGNLRENIQLILVRMENSDLAMGVLREENRKIRKRIRRNEKRVDELESRIVHPDVIRHKKKLKKESEKENAAD